MIKEAITFAERFKADQTQSNSKKDWKGKKFFIVNTKEDNGGIIYDGFEMLDSDKKIEEWMGKNSHYKSFLESINSRILPDSANRALGSSSGLVTYCFFAFKLYPANIRSLEVNQDDPISFKNKVTKTKFNDEELNMNVRIEQIHLIYLDFKKGLDKLRSEGDYKGYFVIIRVDENRLLRWEGIDNKSREEKLSTGSIRRTKGKCSNCKKEGDITPPRFMTNYDDAKIFLRHKTKLSIDYEGKSFLVCDNCGRNITNFIDILKDYRLKIFPLFINLDYEAEEIKIIKEESKEEKNKFAHIFKELKSRKNKNIFDFYLVVKSGDYLFFDYISGYKWELGDYKIFFRKDTISTTINRQGFEREISNVIITKGSWINYFDDKIKGIDNKQTSIIYSIRQKLFDFVYRNQNTLCVDDLTKIIVFRIENEIRNNSAGIHEIRRFLNLYFNKHLLEGDKMSEDKVLLNKVKLMKEAITSGDFDKFEIRDDEEWAYWTGQIAYYLVSLSKSKDKNFGLLEPFTNRSTTQLVKRTIGELFEKYKHVISLVNQRFKAIVSKVLNYKIDKSFMDLKIHLYVGVFDDNTIYTKKEKVETEEVE